MSETTPDPTPARLTPEREKKCRDWTEKGMMLRVNDTKGLFAEIDALRAEVDAANAKWILYENEYILPCFERAKQDGIDLEALVAEANGNCVERYVDTLRERVRELTDQRDSAVSHLVKEWPGGGWIVRCPPLVYGNQYYGGFEATNGDPLFHFEKREDAVAALLARAGTGE